MRSASFLSPPVQAGRRLFTLAFTMLAALPALAAKTDVVVLANGDAVTGEVKSLEFGSLSYSTDSMGTVSIDWVDVTALTSGQTLQIELSDGRRYFGTLGTADALNEILVTTASTTHTLDIPDVVRITPINADEPFLARLDGSVTFGFNTQKASEVTTFNLAADVRFRTRQYLIGMKANSSITDQPGSETSARDSLQGNYQRFRPDRWYTEWLASLERNDELGINSRLLAGVGIGRYIVQTNEDQFSLTGGVVATRESFVGDASSTTNAEGLIQVRYLHRNLEPDTSMTFTWNVYPLLEDLKEFRSETDLTFRREFIGDLFFDVTLYHSFLSDPPPDAAESDYGITSSLGYSF